MNLKLADRNKKFEIGNNVVDSIANET